MHDARFRQRDVASTLRDCDEAMFVIVAVAAMLLRFCFSLVFGVVRRPRTTAMQRRASLNFSSCTFCLGPRAAACTFRFGPKATACSVAHLRKDFVERVGSVRTSATL